MMMETMKMMRFLKRQLNNNQYHFHSDHFFYIVIIIDDEGSDNFIIQLNNSVLPKLRIQGD